MVKISLHFDVNNYGDKLAQELDSHVISLKCILKSIDDDFYLTFSEVKIGIGGMKLTNIEKAEFRNQELKKAFISIIRSFQNFVDKLIAITEFVSKTHVAETSVRNESELNEYLQMMEEKAIHEVSTDRKLNFPKKLEYLTVQDPLKEILLGYSLLRNNLEHHKDIASKDAIFKLLVSTMFVNGKEITELPFNVKKGDLVGYAAKVIERTIVKGTKIEILETEIHETVFTLGKIIAPSLIDSTMKRLVSHQPKE
jgi:hypothetical protein